MIGRHLICHAPVVAYSAPRAGRLREPVAAAVRPVRPSRWAYLPGDGAATAWATGRGRPWAQRDGTIDDRIAQRLLRV